MYYGMLVSAGWVTRGITIFMFIIGKRANQLYLHQDHSLFTAWNVKHNLDILHPVSARVSLPGQLKKRGLESDKIDTVLFRYVEDEASPLVRSW